MTDNDLLEILVVPLIGNDGGTDPSHSASTFSRSVEAKQVGDLIAKKTCLVHLSLVHFSRHSQAWAPSANCQRAQLRKLEFGMHNNSLYWDADILHGLSLSYC